MVTPQNINPYSKKKDRRFVVEPALRKDCASARCAKCVKSTVKSDKR